MKITKLVKILIPVLLLLLLLSNRTDGLAQSELDIAVHYVDGTPAQEESSYDVAVYLSVVDGRGYSIRDLPRDSFFVTEDSQKVAIQNVRGVENEPLNIVLIIDSSEGMSGIGIDDTRSAIQTFVSTLKPNDQVAIIAFDNKVRTLIDFSLDRAVIADQLALIPPFSDAGTCMYDAAYSGIQLASTLPSGNRAAILFTDGIDETETGAICSIHTVDDVIDLASGGGTRTPVYTVEMGGATDSNILRRIADMTGGLYLHSYDAFELATILQQLSDELRSQYILTYQSFAGSGPHTVSVSVNQSGMQAMDTREFVLPILPTRIAFVTPLEGEVIGDALKVEVSLIPQSGTVDRVAFQVNGAVVGTDDAKPYELTLDMRQFPAGVITISAIAYGPNNNELTNSTLNLFHSTSAIEPTGMLPAEIDSSPSVTAPGSVRPVMLLGLLLGGLGILTIGLLISMLMRQRQREETVNEVDEIDNRMFVQEPDIPAFNEIHRTEKKEIWGNEPDTAFGTLLVESSDDATLIGHRFHIISETTTLGRSADNDITFPKDNPVSRRHAEIIEKDERLFLREIQSAGASGEAISPKYGTFLNQKRVGMDPVLLHTGDKILLGKRVQLLFEAGRRLRTFEGRTFDDMTALDDIDKTQTQS